MKVGWRSRMATRIAIATLVLAGGVLCFTAAQAPGTTAGYIASVRNSADTASTAANFTCAGAVAVDKSSAIFQYELNEPTNSVLAVDYASGLQIGTYQGSMVSSATKPIACPRDTGGAYVLNGSTSYVSYPTQFAGPNTFSLELWFKTTVPSGKLIGFGSSQTGSSGQYDRHVYLSTTGQLIFGVYNGGTNTITSPASYTDGNWHQVVATFSTSVGMALYVDGKLVNSSSAFNVAEAHSGYWRIGYDNLSGWPNSGTNYFFTGSMRFAAAYSVVLTPTQVLAHYVAGH